MHTHSPHARLCALLQLLVFTPYFKKYPEEQFLLFINQHHTQKAGGHQCAFASYTTHISIFTLVEHRSI